MHSDQLGSMNSFRTELRKFALDSVCKAFGFEGKGKMNDLGKQLIPSIL